MHGWTPQGAGVCGRMISRMCAMLSTDMDDPEARPYFLWSENMTNRELREILEGSEGPFLQHMYMGRILREASIQEAWKFLTPENILANWERIRRHLGRRRQFWEYLLSVWEEHGLVTR